MKLSLLTLTVLIIFSNCQPVQEVKPTHISQPVVIEDDDWRFEGTENIILVPENRNEENSRLISLHYFHFPAKEQSNLPPVAFLGAGPGEPYSYDVFFDGSRAEAWRWELELMNQKRDILLINQRGNPDSPGLSVHNFIYRWNNDGSLEEPFDPVKRDQNRLTAFQEKIEEYQSQGIDLRGYDIIHLVDDIEDVRKQVGADKLALVGNSFGSQWGLAYIQRYEDHVDRALFSGVEPLDNNYDDPDGIWAVLEMIEAYAKNDSIVKNDLPAEGLLEAFKTIITRLEKEPGYATVIDEDDTMNVAVGADDLRMHLLSPYARSYYEDVETWPTYIMEMYNGDYSALAEASIGRMYNSRSRMINPLINNSLGISKAREEMLNSRESVRWLGNINSHYTTTRDICPTPKVPEDFLQHKSHDIPVLLIQGDMDMSTPYENATFLMEYLDNGHLLTVKRGFHNAKRALIFEDRELATELYEFMNVDFEKTPFGEWKSSVPGIYEMPAFEFWSVKD
ncbi:MAG: alpha/beta hydrolase [Bacteroidota bacterium]